MTTVDTPLTGPIRQAVRADLMAVVRLERRLFEEPWRLASFEQFLDSPGFLVMEDPSGRGLGDDLAAYIVSNTLDRRGRRLGHVKDLGVKPKRQREGRGRTILRRALGVLRTEGAESVRLEVRPSNKPAIELYRGEGFEVVARDPNYYPDGEDALILKRPFAP